MAYVPKEATNSGVMEAHQKAESQSKFNKVREQVLAIAKLIQDHPAEIIASFESDPTAADEIGLAAADLFDLFEPIAIGECGVLED